MQRLVLSGWILGFLIGTQISLAAQDQPTRTPQDKKKVKFAFRDASPTAFLGYVAEVTGLQIVEEHKLEGTITAYSDAEIPVEQVLQFVETVLNSKGATLERVGASTLKVVSIDEARKRGVLIVKDPDKIPANDQVITIVIPLEHLKASDLDRTLAGLLQPRPGAQPVVKDLDKNALIVTNTGNELRRLLEILRVVDVPPDYGIIRRAIKLERIDAGDAANVLNKILQGGQAAPGQRDPSAINLLRALGGERAAPPTPGVPPSLGKGAARDVYAIVPDAGSNSLIVIATEENVKTIEKLAKDLDAGAPSSLTVKHYALISVQVAAFAQTLTQLFGADARAGAGGPQAGELKPRLLKWYREEELGKVIAAFPARLLFEQKSNSMLVVGTSEQIELLDRIVASIDYATVIKTFPLIHASAKEAQQLVTQVLRSEGTGSQIQISADDRTNQIVAAGSEEQLARVEQVLKSLDRQMAETLKTRVIRVQHADAKAVARLLQELLAPKDQDKTGYFVRSVQILTDERTNSIILRAPESYFVMAEEVVARLDIEAEAETVEVISLRNRKASTLAPRIQEILNEADRPVPSPRHDPAPGQDQSEPPQPKPELPRGGKVQADDETNSLIVRGSKRDVAAIRLLAGRLDKFEPQTLIQVLMAEVTLDHDLEYGVQWFWQNKHTVSGDPATTKITGATGNVPANLSYSVVSNEFEFMLKAFAQDGRLKLLANPSIFVKDGKTGDISIGQRVPFVDSTRQTPEGGTLVTIRYEDVGIKLVVTPKINPDGLVTMDVLSEISEFSLANTVPLTSDVNAPTFSKNSAKTVLTIKSGQPVFLGGLIRESEEEVHSKIPLLGDLPGIGALFSSTKKIKQRRELVMLIRPHVAWTQRELEELTQAEVGKLKLLTERELKTQSKRWMDDFSK